MKITSDEPTRLNNIKICFLKRKKEYTQNTGIHVFSICTIRGIPQEIFKSDPEAFSYFYVK